MLQHATLPLIEHLSALVFPGKNSTQRAVCDPQDIEEIKDYNDEQKMLFNWMCNLKTQMKVNQREVTTEIDFLNEQKGALIKLMDNLK